MKPVLVDTDVLIDFLRGSTAAVNWMDQLQKRPLVSVITVAELRSGMRGKEEPALEHLVGAMAVCPIDATIARMGGDFRRQYGPSHGTGLADALIAATAVSENAALRTFNARHFPMLEDVQEPYRK